MTLPRRPTRAPGVEPADYQRDAARERLYRQAEPDPCLECDGEGCDLCDGTGDAPPTSQPDYRRSPR